MRNHEVGLKQKTTDEAEETNSDIDDDFLLQQEEEAETSRVSRMVALGQTDNLDGLS